ncbi:MAG: hypothetical protein PVS3B3_35960 [Ktedonobacteraceae bacterium]
MSPEQSPNKIGKSVGEKIRAARIALHYTQSKLAAPDFSVSYISAIERGQIHPSLRALEILAGRLGLASTELLPKHPHQNDHQSAIPLHPEREDDEGEMVLLDVQLRISQNEPEKAFALLSKMSAKRLKRSQQLWHRYLLGCSHFLMDHLEEAEHIFSDMTHMVKDANNHYLHTQILFMLGNTFAAMHNPTQALLAHQRCLNLLEEAPVRDIFLIAQTFMQLGTHFVEVQQSDEAHTMFRNALNMLAQLRIPQEVNATNNALAQYAIDNQDYYAAALYGYRALAHSEQAAQQQLRGDVYHYLGHALIRGDQKEAYVQLSALKERETTHLLVQASITARIAEWHLARQNIGEARTYAEQACKMAQPFGKTIITADALVVLGRIEYSQQAFDTGDEHFVQGLTMLEYLHRQEEFTAQSIQYAQLLEARGKDREAFTYFRRAYQSRM